MIDYRYRINGFEQIKAFYSWIFNNQDKNLSTSHVSLYLFLVNQNNRNNWVEWFKCPYDLGMSGSCIGSRNTYYRCLEDLKSWQLIDYQKGINNYKAPLIKLCLFNNEHVTEHVPVPLSEPLTKPLTMPLSEPLTEHIYKLLTNNLKLITDNIEDILIFLDSKQEGKEDKEGKEDNSNIAFENFWNLYDKKVDKKKCELKWNRLTDKERSEIISKVPAYIQATPDKKFRRDPETYLNNKSWENEIINRSIFQVPIRQTCTKYLQNDK